MVPHEELLADRLHVSANHRNCVISGDTFFAPRSLTAAAGAFPF
ncbi:MAG TPA: hypothetical protein VK932_02180 [Kofleriaceae bacterium]|nr:hypothetical protein [Kofleriaceae bacterium]